MSKLAQIHTSEHVFWQVLKNKYPSLRTAGLELNEEKTRIDYKCDQDLTKVDLGKLEEEVNEITAKGLPVVFEVLSRDEAAKKTDLSLVPENIKEIRLVKIGDFSCEACIGEHVTNTSQIGRFKILEVKRIGKDSYRFYVAVEEKIETKNQTISAKAKIIPQTLKGFNDWFAEDVKLREYVIDIFKQVFEKYGYEPLETPALEYSELILGQSGEEAEKQYYRFNDPGGRDVMLKYEVMIGMCRAVAANLDKITFPYKRYQIQPVWRAENTQKGRFRQFTQADADTIGSASMLADGEFIQMGLEITEKLGFKEFVARISNRKFLDGLREYLDIPPEKFYGLCMSLDKMQKIGTEAVKEELINKRGISSEKTTEILQIIDPKRYEKLNNYQIIDNLMLTIGKTKIGQEGLRELREVFHYLKIVNVPDRLYRFDPSIARGLASYTGPVWEFEVIEGNVGSIAGCGRYDNAIGKYLGAGKKIPATGGSFGIERICEILKDRKMANLGKTNTRALVTVFSPDYLEKSIEVATLLRYRNEVNTELYPDPEAKLDKQLKYADKKGIPYVVIIGPNELAEKTVVIKNMRTGEQKKVKTTNLNELETNLNE